MRFRTLTSGGDWTFGAGRQTFALDMTALQLNIRTRLLQWRGDCFYAPEEGVDWNNFLDIGTKDFLDRDIRRVILQTPGVLFIRGYKSELSRDSRQLSIEVRISTIYGNVRLEDVL